MIGRKSLWLLGMALATAPLLGQVRDFYNNPEDARGCIGGRGCGGSNSRLRIRLDDRRVSEIRFRAHDNIGGNRNGRLRVRIDGQIIEDRLDIASQGERYTLDARGARGRELVFEPASDDEVDISDVRVIYAGAGGGGGGGGESNQGGCIGGSRCGGSRASIRIPLRDRPVREVTFYAHDDIGGSRDGRLRVRIDGVYIERALDIRRSNERYTLNVNGMLGRELVFEPAANDEVEVRDIRIRYGRGEREPY